MKIVQLTDSIGVAAQIAPADVAEIAAQGYKVIINNRPDGEEENQPSGAQIEAAANAAGLEYHYMPVTAGSFPGSDFDAMADFLDDTARPVLAFCRTGTRCTNLWVASRDESTRQDAMVVGQQKGFELGMAARFLGNA
ncbi:MAG: hypothetical protein ACI9JM_001525 [Halioglobus sp.]|jgi:uncharacterized protein (TIGR01244 family)